MVSYWHQQGNCCREIRTLPDSFVLLFAIKTIKLIAPESSGFDSLRFPDGFLFESISKVYLHCRGDSMPERFIYTAVRIPCQNGSIYAKNGQQKLHWSLYTSIWRPTPWWETVLWTQRAVNWHRPGACIQASGAQHHDEKQFCAHKEWSTTIALKLVYKHLVPNTMMRNSFMNTKNGTL